MLWVRWWINSMVHSISKDETCRALSSEPFEKCGFRKKLYLRTFVCTPLFFLNSLAWHCQLIEELEQIKVCFAGRRAVTDPTALWVFCSTLFFTEVCFKISASASRTFLMCYTGFNTCDIGRFRVRHVELPIKGRAMWIQLCLPPHCYSAHKFTKVQRSTQCKRVCTKLSAKCSFPQQDFVYMSRYLHHLQMNRRCVLSSQQGLIVPWYFLSWVLFRECQTAGGQSEIEHHLLLEKCQHMQNCLLWMFSV